MNVFSLSIVLLFCLCAAVSAKPVTSKECEDSSKDCDLAELEDKPDDETENDFGGSKDLHHRAFMNLIQEMDSEELSYSVELSVSMILAMCKRPRTDGYKKVKIGCGLCACDDNSTFSCTDVPCPVVELPRPDCHWERSMEDCCGYPVCSSGVEARHPIGGVPFQRMRRAGEMLVIDPAEHAGIEKIIPGIVQPPVEEEFPKSMPAAQADQPEILVVDPNEQDGIDVPVQLSNLKKRDAFDDHNAIVAAVENFNPRVIESVAKEYPKAVSGVKTN